MGQMNTYGKANVRINSLSHEAKSRKKLQPCFSSIVNEVIGTIYLFIYLLFYKDILHKKTQVLFKYLNTPKKHNKAHKQLSFRYCV